MVGRPSRWSGSGLEAFRRVRMPSRKSGGGREALTVVREWSGGHLGGLGPHPGCPGVVVRPSSSFGSGRDTLPKVRQCC